MPPKLVVVVVTVAVVVQSLLALSLALLAGSVQVVIMDYLVRQLSSLSAIPFLAGMNSVCLQKTGWNSNLENFLKCSREPS